MCKAIVIGCPGAGKSTFARKLRDLTHLPLYYLDMLWHQPDGTHVSRAVFDARLESLLHRDRWIIDGNYGRTLERRLQACDTVFLLDYPLSVCLEGAKARIGQKREDFPWLETEFDPELQQEILDYGTNQLPQIYRLLERYGEGRQIHVFQSRADADAYLRSRSRTLETSHLLLRPWTEDDAEELYRYAQDPAVGPRTGWPVHTSVAHSRQVIRDALSVPETYAVVLKRTGLPVGSISAFTPHIPDIAPDEREIGYWIGVPYWGQGLIPEAVRELQRHCFEELGCSVLWCGYFDGNVQSRRVQEKCGFRYHHTQPNQPCPLLGETRTVHYTRLTKAQWQSMGEGSSR